MPTPLTLSVVVPAWEIAVQQRAEAVAPSTNADLSQGSENGRRDAARGTVGVRDDEESSFSTGAEFIADGGETAGLIRLVGSPAEHAVSGGR